MTRLASTSHPKARATSRRTSFTTARASSFAVSCATALALSLAAPGCQTATREGDELDQAKVEVHRFFDALGQGDCPTLGSLVPAAREPGACDKLLHEWRDDLHIQLIDLPDVRRDGRDRRAIIVTATVLRHEQQKTMLVRVTHEQGAWQLVL